MLSVSGGSSPSMRRAPRETHRVSHSPFTSSSACSVEPCLARTEVTWSRIGRPSARERLLDATCHSRPYTPDVGGNDGGGPPRPRDGAPAAAGFGYVFHSPVIDPIASPNSSAVSRRTSGPSNTYLRAEGSVVRATAGI